MAVALYARVSTSKQAERDDSGARVSYFNGDKLH